MRPANPSLTTHRYGTATTHASAGAVVAIVGVHVGVLAWLTSLDVLPLPLPITTLMVRIVPPAAPPRPEIAPARRQTIEQKPTPPRKPRTQPPPLAEQAAAGTMSEAPVTAARTP